MKVFGVNFVQRDVFVDLTHVRKDVQIDLTHVQRESGNSFIENNEKDLTFSQTHVNTGLTLVQRLYVQARKQARKSNPEIASPIRTFCHIGSPVKGTAVIVILYL